MRFYFIAFKCIVNVLYRSENVRNVLDNSVLLIVPLIPSAPEGCRNYVTFKFFEPFVKRVVVSLI